MKHNLKDFDPVPRDIDLTPGDSLRIMREFQEMSQNDLSEVSGIPQSTISAIENGRANLGVDRAKTFARALRCHPSVLLFSGWDIDKESAA
jgi:transcriptional regulator with XRE-family HTH domain